ncbi:MAG TPA: hypothetical protein VF212_15420 [Longimicrobiales bacterium]
MDVLVVRPGHEAEDIATGRARLAQALADPGTIVLVVRGGGDDVAGFAERAEDRARDFPWRSVVRVEDPRIFGDGQEERLFGGDATICGVVVGRGGEPGARLRADARRIDIDLAFAGAVAGGGA